MKIAIDARELRDKPTGVGRFLREILLAWNAMPEAAIHEFVLCAPAPVDVTGTGSLRLTSMTAPGDGTLWEQRTLPRLVRASGADVLFAPGYSAPLFCKVPMVVAIHDVSFAAHPEWFSWREGVRRRTIVQLTAWAAARVLTISRFSKREIVARLGIDSSKVVVVYPGVTEIVSGLRQAQAALSASKGGLRPSTSSGRPECIEGSSPFPGPTVLFVGSIFNRRHVPELIEGFVRLARTDPTARLEIVGDNRTSPRIDLAEQARSTGLTDRINIRSYVSEEDLRGLYASASVFVFLSEYEGFGLTPLEALAAGVPVLLLDTPLAREVCGDSAMYVARVEPALIEAALTRLLSDNDERARLLAAARDVLVRYSWTDCARQVLTVLVSCGASLSGR